MKENEVNFEELYILAKDIRSFREEKANIKTGKTTQNIAEKAKITAILEPKEKRLKDLLTVYFCDAELLYDLYDKFAEVELIRGENGLINAYDTLVALREKKFNLFNAALFISTHRSRSDLYKDYNNSLNTKFGSLVPFFMSAHKELNGVNYEEWDKEESASVASVLGIDLWVGIRDYLKPITGLDDDLLALRTKAFEESKSPSYTSYFLKRISHKKDGKIVRLSTFVSHMKSQFWVANVQKRTKYMILDTIDWDNMPEAFDEKNDDYVETIINKEKKQEAYVLPW